MHSGGIFLLLIACIFDPESIDMRALKIEGAEAIGVARISALATEESSGQAQLSRLSQQGSSLAGTVD
jgi:hypothetical protein